MKKGTQMKGPHVLEGAHAVPRALDVLAAKHAEHDHKRVEEVHEVPARHRVLVEPITRLIVQYSTRVMVCSERITMQREAENTK